VCHGPDANQRKGDLRLDMEEDAYRAVSGEMSKSAFVIAPGDVAGSELAHRIISDDPEFMMPPQSSNLFLSDREKAILLRWIEQGAEYKLHWSFNAPKQRNPPNVHNDSWVQNPIDNFVLEKMEEQDLTPSKEADPAVLLRRIALDLTGLPPTIEEQKKWLGSDEFDVRSVIDHFLSKPQYGERMAMDWMDASRYADSHGYQDDGLRTTWPWRDWVIDKFNANISYDTFLLWQLAGDMLPDPSTDQLLATCFNRNHPQTQEGGVVDEEYRIEYVADRANTIGKAILGLTMECARCHDHKYDPITQKDYYSLFAFFNNNNESGIVPYNGEAAPTIILPRPADKSTLDRLQQSIDSLTNVLKGEPYLRAFEEWYDQLPANEPKALPDPKGLVAKFSFEKEYYVSSDQVFIDGNRPSKSNQKSQIYAYYNDQKQHLDARVQRHPDDRPIIVPEGQLGNGLQFNGDGGIGFNRDLDFEWDQSFSVSIWFKLLKEGEDGPIFGKTNGEFEGHRGWLCKLNSDGTLSFQINHVWPDNCIDFQTIEPVEVNRWTHIVYTYDGSGKADGVEFYIDGERPESRLFADNLAKSVLHGTKGSNWNDTPFQLGLEFRKSMKNVQMDELRIYDRPLAKMEVDALYGEKDLHKYGREDWKKFYLDSRKSKVYNDIQDRIQRLRNEKILLLTDQPEVMVMKERKFARQSFILDRGAYDAPTDSVVPDVPSVFEGMMPLESKDRLGLAKWIIHPENPLTARVQVNRLWNMCFGKGLVDTQEDFGNQGSLPTHPELLDYLARKFVALDWDMKALIREIMLSATYRQSSKTKEDQAKKDPENLFYSHYPAHRLSGETIRDQALASSGLLVKEIGGPSVYPYQPSGIWEALATRNAVNYHQQTGDSLYRRSLYTIWKRSSPPPSMLNFDAPDRYYCVVRRQNTSTPLQSLVLMNDPQFVEAARVLAEEMMAKSQMEESITFAYQKILAREPRTDEMKTLSSLWNEVYQQFRAGVSSADELLSVGDYRKPIGLDKDQLAAHAVVASTIMNYDEFVTMR